MIMSLLLWWAPPFLKNNNNKPLWPEHNLPKSKLNYFFFKKINVLVGCVPHDYWKTALSNISIHHPIPIPRYGNQSSQAKLFLTKPWSWYNLNLQLQKFFRCNQKSMHPYIYLWVRLTLLVLQVVPGMSWCQLMNGFRTLSLRVRSNKPYLRVLLYELHIKPLGTRDFCLDRTEFFLSFQTTVEVPFYL